MLFINRINLQMKTKEFIRAINFIKIDFFRLHALVFLLLITSSLKAGDEYFSCQLKGAGLIQNAQCNAKDTMFQRGLSPDWINANHIRYQRVTNRIVLKVDTGVYSPTYYSCTINLEIKYRDKDNHNKIYTPALTVEFQNGTTATEKDQFVYQFFGGHDVTVKIISIQVNGVNAAAPPNLILENTILVNRFYELNTASFPGFLDVIPKNGDRELEVKWTPLLGAEEYQLEWMHINDYDGTSVNGSLSTSDLYFDFSKNATRVSLSSSTLSYTINNVYEKGYLIFRHRAIGRTGAGNTIPVEGAWSSPNKGKLSDYSTLKRYRVLAHQEDKINWLYTAAFAEEGKKKENVSYMDGTNRSRQSVSKLNTENQTIVSETIYDKEGRAAVSILPSPSVNSALTYNKNYNRNEGGKDYSSPDFESNSSPCINQASTLKVNSGASKYFSPSNTNKIGMQAYLPDAGGYPLSQIEYTPDNTGRIRRQGGVGPSHQLNSGNEISNYFGKPLQEELDKLFGSEAGHYSHYKKNMVRDANGQLSVTYADMYGRTIATALAGQNPSNLDPINSPGAIPTTTVNILDNKPVIKGDKALRSQFVYLANTRGFHEFKYEVTSLLYDDENCVDTTICFECVYDLEISVTDECGVEKLADGKPIRKTIGQLNFICDSPESKLEQSFIVDFDKEGTYYINKTLTVNQKALNDGLEYYIKNKSCVKSYNDFVKEELVKTNFTSCGPSVTCEETCLQSLGSEAWYLFKNPGKTHKDYLRAMLACRMECKSADVLDTQYKLMLMDMSPGGQYADTTWNPDGSIDPTGRNSIFHPDNHHDADLSDPSIVFRDEDGNIDHVTLPDGSIKTPNELFASSLNEFTTYWKPSWAEALVKFHPEYEYYQSHSSDIVRQMSLYEMLMINTDTYEEALRLGLLNPLCFSDVPVPLQTDFNTDPFHFIPMNLSKPFMDPFFSNGGAGAPYWDTMVDYLKNTEISKDGYIVKGLWQIAAVGAICNNSSIPDAAACAAACSTYVFSPINATDVCSVDRVWQLFRAMYLAKRKELIDKFIEKDVVEFYGGTSNIQIGHSGNFENKEKRFPTVIDDLKLKFGSGVLEKDMTNINQNKAKAEAEVLSNCNQQCEEYAYGWLVTLSGCNPGGKWDNSDSVYVELKEKLIALCKLGCDLDHPLGSSTVPVGNPGVPSGRPGVPDYKSFSDVIKGIFGVEKLECKSTLISMPASYEHDLTTLTAPNVADSCACDKVLYVDNYYNEMVINHTLPAGLTKPKLFEQIYKVSLDDINSKICVCKQALAKGGVFEWNPNINWSMVSVNALIERKEPVPPSITCETCTNCATVKTLVTDFRTMIEAQEGGFIPESKIGLYEKNLANYLNDKLNMDLNILDYNRFLKECEIAASGGYTCVAGPAAIELEKMLNLMVFKNELLFKAELWKSPYTPATLSEKNIRDFSYTDLLAAKVDPLFVPGSFDHLYCFNNVDGNSLYGKILSNGMERCQLQLNFTAPGFKFENIREFTELSIDPKNTGNNYNFIIKAAVAVDDKIEYTYLTGKTTCIPLGECSNNDNTLTLCSKKSDPDEDDCVEELTLEAFSNASILYKNYVNRIKNEFITRYVDKCLKAAENEEFTMKYKDGEYHYTLFYYDQAGNLVRTIPPEGVEPLSNDEVKQIAKDRKSNKRSIFTKHRMATTYEYNSLNQLVNQSVPDHDKLNDWGTYSATSGLAPDLFITKAQSNKEGGSYLIASDSDPTKSVIYYAPDGVSWSPVTDFGITDLSAVHYIGSTGYVVGDKGTLLRTLDGNTWSISSTGINEDLKEIYFSSSNNGIIITKNVNLYTTTNAGITWTLVSGSGLELDEINELTFGSSTNGIAVGRKGVNGAVYKTTNGGLTWVPANSFVTANLKTVHILPDNKTVYASGASGTMIKSTNAGLDWIEMNSNLTVNTKEIFFAVDKIGCALGDDGILYKTTSGGHEWTAVKSPNAGDVYVDIQFIGPATGYALSKKGEVLITNSTGASWTPIYTLSTGGVNMTVIFFESETLGYVAGESGKLHKITKNIYNVYNAVPVSTGMTVQNFASLHFKGATGSAILSNGIIMKSSNGGLNWSNVSPTAYIYNSFSYTSPDIATAVSVGGKTAYTTNAGLSWTNGSDLPASGIAITTNSSGNAIVVGSGGNIFSSMDYGTSWSNNTQKIKPLVIRGGFMKNSSTAYIAGYGGSAYKSTDGGLNWKVIPTNTTKNLEDIGENNGNVVLCGSNGTILVSTNITVPAPEWTAKNVTTATKQNRHLAFSGVRGYITTSDGKILVSSDYGGNWMEYYSGSASLSGLYMLTESLGYAVGEKGNIIKITPAPPVSLLKGIRPAKLSDTHCEGDFAIAVGTGVILKSEDGGKSWKNIVTSPSAIMRAVAFVKPESGSVPSVIVNAGNGLVSRSVDGGAIFNPVSSPAITAGTNLSAMCMIDSQKVYAVGDLGVIRRSMDGGLTWAIVTSPVSDDLTSVTIKGKIGFITGKNGIILKSEDAFGAIPGWFKLQAPGNESWVKYLTHLNPVPALNSVYFHDYTSGYVAGDKGVVLKTMNGGVSWEQMPMNGIADLKYITFSSDIQGKILGSNTTVLNVHDDNDNISTRFYYDRLGRLVASQNTKQHQMVQPRFSYTRYDEQNRIIETGEVATHLNNLSKYMVNAPTFPDNISDGKYNVTTTYYDVPLNPEINGFFGAGGQQNLRSRIATVTVQEVYDASKIYDHATHYSYDVHGNVKSVVQDNPELE